MRALEPANVDLLKMHPLFRLLTSEQLLRFAQFGELELYKPGENIVVAGTLGDSCYLVLSGQVEVIPETGGAPLATLEAGEFFGEMSLIEPATRSATVRAKALSELFRVPNFSFSNLLKDD